MTELVEEKKIPALYILMRDDLDSMNAGKGMAQACHAANAFAVRARQDKGYKAWAAETSQSFGTTITLAVNAQQLYSAVAVAEKLGFMAEVIHDPTYPLVDEVVHLLPMDTCGYVFVPDKDDPVARMLLGRFSLHA